ncbi:hypothetical protein PTKIN_Ptkin10aG0132100 [Pterospermum kingtungense]
MHRLHAFYEWIHARDAFQPGGQPRSQSDVCQKWHPPPPSFVKCNCDAATFSDSGRVGLGMVLRDEQGHFLACRMLSVSGLPAVPECEALGLFEAIAWT